MEGLTKTDYSLSTVRWLRVLGAAVAVIALSFLVLTGVVTVYSFILAFQARGSPDQAAISQFGRSVSRWLIPLSEMTFTLLAAAVVARKTDKAGLLHGLLVGIAVGLLDVIVTLTFHGRLDFLKLSLVLIIVGLGWLGGLVGWWGRARA
jgi:hypothetical protein